MLLGRLNIDPPVLLAPMAGVTDSPFRQIVKQLGCPVVVTEMVSAEGIRRKASGSWALLRFEQLERPVFVQLFGSNPHTMAEAASYCESLGFDGIDINMGCPVKKVVNNGGGVALMRDPLLAAKIIEAVRCVVKLPLTAKLRAGWSPIETNVVEVSRCLWQSGVDAVTVHPRTRNQFFSGKADWNLIGQTVDAVDIPVIGNGDLRTPQDALNMVRLTACAGVMVGRAAMGNPWLPGKMAVGLAGSSENTHAATENMHTEEIRRVFCDHVQKMIKFMGSEYAAVMRMRKHLIWYTRGMVGCAGLRKNIASILTEKEMIGAFTTLLVQQSGKLRV